MKNFLRQHWLHLLLAFFLPALIMGIIYATQGIWWGGPNTILAGDAYHQYVALDSLYSQILRSAGKLGFFYTWTSGLGLNLYAFASYYMGSFFMPLTVFFDARSMPDGMYLIALLKFGAMGLTAFISFQNMYRRVSSWLVIALSTSYALMSFITSQNEITMWLDVFILLPLIVWGLHALMDEGKRVLYYATLAILFIQNYYFGFIFAIFITLYFLARLLGTGWRWRRLFDFIITSLLSGLTALIMLLPMYLDLKANGQAFSPSIGLLTDNSWGLDFFAKSFTGTYDTTQYGAIPMIYVGLLPLILAFTFFLMRGISWRLKLGFGLLIAFIITSFYLQPLDLFWQGMHTPNMFLHRYSFVLSILLLILSFEVLSRFSFVRLWQILIVYGILLAGFTAAFLVGRYKFLGLTNVLLTGLFLLAFLILLIGVLKHFIPLKLFVALALTFVAVDTGVNAYYQVTGVADQWNYPNRQAYNQNAAKFMNLSSEIQQLSVGQLVRTDNTAPDTANDSMKFGWNAIAQFSSVRNSNSSAALSRLGFQTDGEYLNLRYPANTLLMDSIFGIEFNINEAQPAKFGFNPVDLNLYQNKAALPLGIIVPGGFKDVTYLNQTDYIVNQTAFVNELAGQNKQYFKPFYSTSESVTGTVYNNSGYISLTKNSTDTRTLAIRYQVTVPANSQAYIQVANLNYGDPHAQTMTVNTGLSQYTIGTTNTGSFFNLGYFSKETPLDLTLTFPNSYSVNFDQTKFWALDIPTYSQTLAKLAQNPVTAEPAKNGANLTYQSDRAGDLFLTVPYDKGWSAQLDGKTVKVTRAQGGFMKISAPAGKHIVTLRFFPNGLNYGMLAFIAGIVLFILYNLFIRLRARGREKRATHI